MYFRAILFFDSKPIQAKLPEGPRRRIYSYIHLYQILHSPHPNPDPKIGPQVYLGLIRLGESDQLSTALMFYSRVNHLAVCTLGVAANINNKAGAGGEKITGEMNDAYMHMCPS